MDEEISPEGTGREREADVVARTFGTTIVLGVPITPFEVVPFVTSGEREDEARCRI